MHLNIYILEGEANQYGFHNFQGRTIVQAASRLLPTAAVSIRLQFILCGICGGKSGTWAEVLRVFLLPLPIFIAQTATHKLIIPSATLYGLGTISVVKSFPTNLRQKMCLLPAWVKQYV
jgi:hypothetical protein